MAQKGLDQLCDITQEFTATALEGSLFVFSHAYAAGQQSSHGYVNSSVTGNLNWPAKVS